MKVRWVHGSSASLPASPRGTGQTPARSPVVMRRMSSRVKRSWTSPIEYCHSQSYSTVANDIIGSGLNLVMCGNVIGRIFSSFIRMNVRLASWRCPQMPAAGTMCPSASW